MVIPFTVTVPRGQEDLRLHEKLRGELSGILNWILEGRARLVRNGYRFTQSKTVDDATYWYERNSNPAIAFMMDEGYSAVPVSAGDMPEDITPAELYRRYEEYCRNTLTFAVNSDTFTKTLISKGYRDPRKRHYRLYRTKQTKSQTNG